METPRPAALSLDEREARCAGAREKLGDVLGPATFTMVSGESLEIQAATTVSVRASLAEKAGCSQAGALLRFQLERGACVRKFHRGCY